MDRPTWRRSSHSSPQGGNCVEVANLNGGAHAVRDSKDPTCAHLTFTTAQWGVFTTGVKSGEFD